MDTSELNDYFNERYSLESLCASTSPPSPRYAGQALSLMRGYFPGSLCFTLLLLKEKEPEDEVITT
jgi:hypothetical protein